MHARAPTNSMYPKNPMTQSGHAETGQPAADQPARVDEKAQRKALEKAERKADKKDRKKADKKAERKAERKAVRKAERKAEKRAQKAARQAADASPGAEAPARGRRIQVRRSGVHGKGVFALRPIAKGETLIEYTGERIDWPEALRRHPHDPNEPNHTFYFSVGDDHVIDALHGGNASRWINHSCEPNCMADEHDDGRVFIVSRRRIDTGEELFYDYGLVIDEPYTRALKKQYECRCGAKKCRGTMLAPKD